MSQTIHECKDERLPGSAISDAESDDRKTNDLFYHKNEARVLQNEC